MPDIRVDAKPGIVAEPGFFFGTPCSTRSKSNAGEMDFHGAASVRASTGRLVTSHDRSTPGGCLNVALRIALKEFSTKSREELFRSPVSGTPAMREGLDSRLIGFNEESLEQTAMPDPPSLKADWEKPTNNKYKKDNTMTPKNKIEFAPMPGIGKHKAPWDRTVRSPYEDLIFKDELAAKKLILKTGQNWVRVVPALMGSDNWMTHVVAVAMHHARFPHPRTFRKEGQSIFERTYEWLAANAPEQLYNRGNPKGHRLLCDNLCAFWCLVENNGGGIDARLFLGSSDKGSETRVAGLGYRIWEKLTEPDEDVDAILEPLDPHHGTMICIEKSQPAGAKFATYHLRVGRQAGPIQNLFDRMERSEFATLCPIEQTIRELSKDEQYEHLVRAVGAATAAAIRSSDA